jgi:GT2 family glycosyltransferase
MKMTPGSFCVVTPNLNMAEYLADTIESVLANLGPGDQYFVIDGGSTDGSINIIKSYKDRLTGWCTEPDRGYADAVRKGFSMGNTEFQCWTPCGDLLLHGALDLAREVFAQCGADMIFGDDLYINEIGQVVQITKGGAVDLTAMMLYGSWTPLQDACFWRSSLYDKIGGIDQNLRYAADYDLFLRMSLVGKCIYTPHVFGAFRKHPGQTSEKYRIAYRMEKNTVRENIMRRSHGCDRRLFERVYYAFYARLRSRFFNSKPLHPALESAHVENLCAGLSKKYGVIL